MERKIPNGIGRVNRQRGAHAMKIEINSRSSQDIVTLYISIILQQHDAAIHDSIRLYNKYYSRPRALANELKSRPGDDRRLLITLLSHKNSSVRFASAVETITIEHQLALQTLEQLADSGDYPNEMNARSLLRSLKNGRFVPE